MPIDDLTALGQKMREARKNKELTQQELSDLSHVSVKQIANIEKGKIQLQKTGADHLMGEVAASDPGGFPLGTDGLHHQLHNLVQVLPVGGKLPAHVVILDVLQNQIPITFHL